jgi:hypothetical protein
MKSNLPKLNHGYLKFKTTNQWIVPQYEIASPSKRVYKIRKYVFVTGPKIPSLDSVQRCEGKEMSVLFFRMLIRYCAAIFVACAVSVATFFLGIGLIASIVPEDCPASLSEVLMSAILALVGFLGVFSATFCLKQCSRRYGAIFFLSIGIGFYTWLVLILGYGAFPSQYRGVPHFWPLMIGGFGAVLFFWFQKKRKTPN